jgi:hypothetical protein
MNYDEWDGPHSSRIIVRRDYRHFEYMITPTIGWIDPNSHSHRNMFARTHPLVEAYFRDRDVEVSRNTETRNNGRWYVIMFSRLDDAQMFYLALAEHIDTLGVTFERFKT